MPIQARPSNFDELMIRLRRRRREAVNLAGTVIAEATQPGAHGLEVLLAYVAQLHAFNCELAEIGEMIGEAKVEREARDEADDADLDEPGTEGGEGGVASF